MTQDSSNRRHFLSQVGAAVVTGATLLHPSAQANNFPPTRSMRGGSNNYRPGAPIVDLTVGEAASGYRWEVVKSSDGQYFTRFVASNGETMVRSERYTQKHNAKNCASSVSNNVGSARVIDETKAQAA